MNILKKRLWHSKTASETSGRKPRLLVKICSAIMVIALLCPTHRADSVEVNGGVLATVAALGGTALVAGTACLMRQSARLTTLALQVNDLATGRAPLGEALREMRRDFEEEKVAQTQGQQFLLTKEKWGSMIENAVRSAAEVNARHLQDLFAREKGVIDSQRAECFQGIEQQEAVVNKLSREVEALKKANISAIQDQSDVVRGALAGVTAFKTANPENHEYDDLQTTLGRKVDRLRAGETICEERGAATQGSGRWWPLGR